MAARGEVRSHVELASDRVGGVLSAFRAARETRGLTSEEALVFLAVGHLGLRGDGGVLRLRPCIAVEISDFLAIPRETVRRKLIRLGDRGLLEPTPRGTVVRDVRAWLEIAAAFGRHEGPEVAASRIEPAWPVVSRRDRGEV